MAFFRSLRERIFLAFLLVLLLSMGIVVGIVFDLNRRALRHVEEEQEKMVSRLLRGTWEEKVLDVTSMLADRFITPLHDFDVSEMYYLSDLAMRGRGILYVYVQDREGRVLIDATEAAEAIGTLPTDEFSRKAVDSAERLIQRKPGLIEVSAPVLLNVQRLGTVRIGFSPEAIELETARLTDSVGRSFDQVLWGTLMQLLLAALAAIVVTAFVAALLARKIARPVQSLVGGTEAVAAGDFSHTVPVDSSEELNRLADSFNVMKERIRATMVSRDYFEGIVANMMSALFIIDGQGRITLVNDAAVELLGYERSELIGQKLVAALMIEDSTSGDIPGDSNTVEMVLSGRNRERRTVLFSAVSVPGRPEGEPETACFALDISSRKKIEDNLIRANEELEKQYSQLLKLDAMKDSLIRDVSHELKTPVAKHSMQLEILRPVAESDALSAQEKNAFEVMGEGIRRQESVIRNLLDLSRLEAGGRKYRREKLMIGEVCGQVLSDYRYVVERYGVDVFCDVPPLEVLSDSEMLWHILSNLVNNAIKFRQPDVQASIRISAETAGSEILVRVTDNGIGMNAEELEQVFERFYQSSASIEGSGVGLTISKMIAEGLGGRLWLESEGSNRGAVAVLALPAAKEGDVATRRRS